MLFRSRAFAGGRWDLRRLTRLGQEVTLTALVRGDVYHSDENLLTAIPGYRGASGWQARGIAAVAADMRWPFVGEFMGGTQTLTPRVPIVAPPPIENLDIPNEDADRKSTSLNSSHYCATRMPSSAPK